MRDLYNNISAVRALSPVDPAPADNTAKVSEIIDRQGYESLTFLIITGTLADAGATWTVLVEDGDDAALADNAAVDDSQLLGTEALASFTQADDDSVFKIGYRGYKRYTRLTITPAGNAGSDPMAVIAVLGHPAIAPIPQT